MTESILMQNTIIVSVITIFTWFVTPTLSFAQQQLPQYIIEQAQNETGLTSDQLEIKFKEKGIDPAKVTPADQPRIQQAYSEILAENKASKGDASQTNSASSNNPIKSIDTETVTENIIDEVDEGKELEEAVAEEVIEAINEELPPSRIYGQHIFRNQSIKVYNQTTDLRASEKYVLGPDDILSISIWGNSQFSGTFTIQKDGYIQPSGMGRIYLKGLKFGQAKDLLLKSFGGYYNFKKGEFNVDLSYSRNITVNISGEAVKIGSFTMPAINTAFNALVAAGGPSDLGSVRHIKLYRSGETTRTIDVYEYILNPATAEEFYLQDGDFIFIPVTDKEVTIKGAIKRPYKYELTETETLEDLITYAGGFTPNAQKSTLQVKRIEDDEIVVLDVPYGSNKKYSVNTGDIFSVRQISDAVEDYVEIKGAVYYPDQYELKNGMHISDLLKLGRLKEQSRLDYAALRRKNNDGTSNYLRINLSDLLTNPGGENDLVLEQGDELSIYLQSKFVDNFFISSTGAVRDSIKIGFDPSGNLRVSDLIEMSGGLTRDAMDFGFIFRLDAEDPTQTQYLNVDLATITANPNSASNFSLLPQDKLYVPTRQKYSNDAFIVLSGAVKERQNLKFDKSLTIKQMINLAGGLTISADRTRVELYRIDFSDTNKTKTESIVLSLDENDNLIGADADFELKPYDQIVVRNLPDYELQRFVSLSGEVKYPGNYALVSDNETILRIIERAGGLTKEAFPAGATLFRNDLNVGYMVLRLDQAINRPNSPFNYTLMEGDEINIPRVKNYVSVVGYTNVKEIVADSSQVVNNKVTVPYHAGRNAYYYVKEYAGGVNEKGSKSQIFVRSAQGELKRTQNFGLFRIYPKVNLGSEVIVRAKTEKRQERETEVKEPVDWGKVFSNTLAQVTSIVTILILAQQLD